LNAIRIFFVGGLMSYRALFRWQNPTFYIPTMLGHPLFQVLFFAYLGRFSGVRDDAFYVVGNAVQVSAMSGVYGVAMTVGGERWTQTLAPRFAAARTSRIDASAFAFGSARWTRGTAVATRTKSWEWRL
jgi:ABC-2 type transport system permease protein